MTTTECVEAWRPVPGFGDYEVSDLGRVISHRRNGLVTELHRSINTNGYLRVQLAVGGGRYVWRYVHRLVAEAFHGTRPPGLVVRHLNGDALDNRAQNLCWGTPSENAYDRVRHGTHHEAKKTHCNSGHPFDEANTRLYRGRRYCRACSLISQAKRRARAARRDGWQDLPTVGGVR